MQQLTGRWWSNASFMVAVMGFALTLLALPVVTDASCGVVIDSTGAETPVTDCANPLGQATGWPHALTIEGTTVLPKAVVPVLPNTNIELRLAAAGALIDGYFEPALYRHTPGGYTYVDLYPEVDGFALPESVVREFADSYFSDATTAEPFIQAVLTEEAFFSAGDVLNEAEMNTLYDFFDALVRSVEATLHPRWESGTYTVVAEEVCLFLSQQTPTWWLRLQHFFVPVAYAQSARPCASLFEWHTITFTITTDPLEPPPPRGASSVLFLPGIQASRLYAGEDISIPGLANNVHQDERIWEPGNNNDVEALRMFSTGDSTFSVYVDDILESATVDIGLGIALPAGDFYAALRQEFDMLVASGVIADWAPYAYDWRYDVATVVAEGTQIDAAGARHYVSDVVMQLASSSLSGQVTIVAHSNGGLLAKALVAELERRNQAHLVDTIVFVGVPQLGTPKAIGTILHGYDQELGQGWVVDAGRARRIINNLPGAYGLLPAPQYFAEVATPVISFSDGVATEQYRTQYGSSISSLGAYQEFLAQGVSAGSTTLPRYQPVGVNDQLFTAAQTLHEEVLSEWRAPTHVRVVELVGIGLPTPVGVHYRDTGQFICTNSFFGGTRECVRDMVPRPFATLSVFGDQTVVAESAAAYAGDKEVLYVDLLSLSRNDEDQRFSHANMTEAPAVLSLVRQLVSTSSAIERPAHVFDLRPVNTEQVFTVEQIASPVAIATTDAAGRTTGLVMTPTGWEVRREIPGSQFFTFGGVKHLVVPVSDEPRVTTLTGLDDGVFTYAVATVRGEVQQPEVLIANATTTRHMSGQVEVRGTDFGEITYDYDGDGTPDARQAWTGDYATLLSPSDEVEQIASGTPAVASTTPRSTASGTRTARPLVLGVAKQEVSAQDYAGPQLAQLYAALVQLSQILQQLRYNRQ